MTIPNEDLKICSRCLVPTPVNDFYVRKTGRRQAECKSCSRKRNDAWRAQPKVKADHLIYWRKRRAQAKAAVFAAYGDKCACCGETEKCFLSIDHVNNDGAKFRREVLGNRTLAGFHTYRWLMRHNFPKGYQVLCMNCQWGKKLNSGICPHQVTCNDYPFMGVPSSDGKRSATEKSVEDIVCSPDESRSRFIN